MKLSETGEIIGHQSQRCFLKNFLDKELYFSGLLFFGPENIGKKLIAREFLRGLLCQNKQFGGCSNCPVCRDNFSRDFLFINEEFNPKNILTELSSEDLTPYGINTSRAIIKFLSSTPVFSRGKAVLIDNAHLLTPQAQNSLLKIIEEPPLNSVIIFVSHLPAGILETIRSRLMEVRFSLVKKQELDEWIDKKTTDDHLRAEIKRFALLRPGRAQQFLNQPELIKQFKSLVLKLLGLEQKSLAEKIIHWERYLSQEQTADLFELWQIILRDELLQSLGLANQALLLTKPRQREPQKLILSLKKLRELNQLSQRFSALQENTLKQAVLMVE